MNNLGTKIRQIRTLRNMTQDDLAFEMHTTRQTVINWETKEVSPSVEQLQQISKILRVSIDFLLDDSRSINDMKTKKQKTNIQPVRSTMERKERPIESSRYEYHSKAKKQSQHKMSGLAKFGIFLLFLGVLLNILPFVVGPLIFSSYGLDDFQSIVLYSELTAMAPFLGLLLLPVGLIVTVVGLIKKMKLKQ